MYNKTGIFIILLALSIQLMAQESLPKVVNGKIERIDSFKSKYVTSRNIDIWLPEDYSHSTKYSVLYMHDGQMLFDDDQSWNKQAWDIDDVASKLLKNNRIQKIIVVGIWNGGDTRHSDYFPQKPFESLTQTEKDTVSAQLQRAGITDDNFKPQSDNYLKFVVNELKPYIDNNYSVHTNRENAYIAGSSMGGLISLYAICEYPYIFAGAACMSTHWVGTFTLENNPIPDSFIKYLSNNLPEPRGHKIYFDYGDQTLDALYPEVQQKVDSLMIIKGYNEKNWNTKYFPGDDHSEKSWSERLDIPIKFLLKK